MEGISLIERDPALFSGLANGEREQAGPLAVVTGLSLAPGPWNPGSETFNPQDLPGGALVVTGLLSRGVRVGKRTAREFLGPRDVLRPWVGTGRESSSTADVSWEVHSDAVLALLDRDFTDRVSRWPQVSEALMDRLLLRARWLAFCLAACAQTRTERRVLLLLWHFADRWGEPESAGANLPMRLTHELLAEAAGVARQTLSTAVSELQRSGLVSRTQGGAWRLHGPPPQELTGTRPFSTAAS